MKKTVIIVFLFFILCGGVFAQSAAQEIETLLETRAITYAQAARFVLEASDVLVTSNPNEAFNFAAENNWLPRNASPNQAARLNGVALLFMKSFDIPGGLLYSNAGGAHYAYREMVYRGYIQGRIDPEMNVSGELLLFITGRVLSDLERNTLRR